MKTSINLYSVSFVVFLALSLLLTAGIAQGERFIPPVPDSNTLSANDGGTDGCDSSRFKCVLGGEAVLDKQSGLVWARNPDLFKKIVPWEEAVKLCKNVEIGGKKDWRLPTREELISLLDTSQSRPTLPEGNPFEKINEIGYGGQNCVDYWTITEYESDSNSAWMVSFNIGQVMDSLTLFDFSVWPVRDGE